MESTESIFRGGILQAERAGWATIAAAAGRVFEAARRDAARLAHARALQRRREAEAAALEHTRQQAAAAREEERRRDSDARAQQALKAARHAAARKGNMLAQRSQQARARDVGQRAVEAAVVGRQARDAKRLEQLDAAFDARVASVLGEQHRPPASPSPRSADKEKGAALRAAPRSRSVPPRGPKLVEFRGTVAGEGGHGVDFVTESERRAQALTRVAHAKAVAERQRREDRRREAEEAERQRLLALEAAAAAHTEAREAERRRRALAALPRDADTDAPRMAAPLNVVADRGRSITEALEEKQRRRRASTQAVCDATKRTVRALLAARAQAIGQLPPHHRGNGLHLVPGDGGVRVQRSTAHRDEHLCGLPLPVMSHADPDAAAAKRDDQTLPALVVRRAGKRPVHERPVFSGGAQEAAGSPEEEARAAFGVDIQRPSDPAPDVEQLCQWVARRCPHPELEARLTHALRRRAAVKTLNLVSLDLVPGARQQEAQEASIREGSTTSPLGLSKVHSFVAGLPDTEGEAEEVVAGPSAVLWSQAVWLCIERTLAVCPQVDTLDLRGTPLLPAATAAAFLTSLVARALQIRLVRLSAGDVSPTLRVARPLALPEEATDGDLVYAVDALAPGPAPCPGRLLRTDSVVSNDASIATMDSRSTCTLRDAGDVSEQGSEARFSRPGMAQHVDPAVLRRLQALLDGSHELRVHHRSLSTAVAFYARLGVAERTEAARLPAVRKRAHVAFELHAEALGLHELWLRQALLALFGRHRDTVLRAGFVAGRTRIDTKERVHRRQLGLLSGVQLHEEDRRAAIDAEYAEGVAAQHRVVAQLQAQVAQLQRHHRGQLQRVRARFAEECRVSALGVKREEREARRIVAAFMRSEHAVVVEMCAARAELFAASCAVVRAAITAAEEAADEAAEAEEARRQRHERRLAHIATLFRAVHHDECVHREGLVAAELQPHAAFIAHAAELLWTAKAAAAYDARQAERAVANAAPPTLELESLLLNPHAAPACGSGLHAAVKRVLPVGSAEPVPCFVSPALLGPAGLALQHLPALAVPVVLPPYMTGAGPPDLLDMKAASTRRRSSVARGVATLQRQASQGRLHDPLPLLRALGKDHEISTAAWRAAKGAVAEAAVLARRDLVAHGAQPTEGVEWCLRLLPGLAVVRCRASGDVRVANAASGVPLCTVLDADGGGLLLLLGPAAPAALRGTPFAAPDPGRSPMLRAAEVCLALPALAFASTPPDGEADIGAVALTVAVACPPPTEGLGRQPSAASLLVSSVGSSAAPALPLDTEAFRALGLGSPGKASAFAHEATSPGDPPPLSPSPCPGSMMEASVGSPGLRSPMNDPDTPRQHPALSPLPEPPVLSPSVAGKTSPTPAAPPVVDLSAAAPLSCGYLRLPSLPPVAGAPISPELCGVLALPAESTTAAASVPALHTAAWGAVVPLAAAPALLRIDGLPAERLRLTDAAAAAGHVEAELIRRGQLGGGLTPDMLVSAGACLGPTVTPPASVGGSGVALRRERVAVVALLPPAMADHLVVAPPPPSLGTSHFGGALLTVRLEAAAGVGAALAAARLVFADLPAPRHAKEAGHPDPDARRRSGAERAAPRRKSSVKPAPVKHERPPDRPAAAVLDAEQCSFLTHGALGSADDSAAPSGVVSPGRSPPPEGSAPEDAAGPVRLVAEARGSLVLGQHPEQPQSLEADATATFVMARTADATAISAFLKQLRVAIPVEALAAASGVPDDGTVQVWAYLSLAVPAADVSCTTKVPCCQLHLR